MWMVFLLPFVTQHVLVDQINGSWALVELWDGEMVDLHADCLGAGVQEGMATYLSRETMDACAPGNFVSRGTMAVSPSSH